MSSKKPGRKYEVELDYTYISKASVKKVVVGFVCVLVAAVAAVLWIMHEPSAEARAKSAIARAQSDLEAARGTPQAKAHAETLDVASRKLAEAQAARDAGRHPEALAHAVEVQRLAQQVKQAVQESDAQVFDVGGKVELQRASRDRWETARVGMRLFEGDFIKTGANGTADIVSSDGTLFRVKPDSLFEVQRTVKVEGAAPGQSSRRSKVKLTYGTIDIGTGEKSSSTVATDAGAAEVSESSRVGVDVDTTRTDVRAYGGQATFARPGGEKIVLGQREAVSLSREGTETKFTLPEAPAPTHPENNVSYDINRREPVALRWAKVPVAARYKLQIARSRLFVPDSVIVDLADREGTEAVVKVNDEGSYFWRVASVTKENVASEWSEVRRFKVLTEQAATADRRPPDLQVDRPKVFNTVVIVSGKTEPGASVTVNGEPADADSSGAFKKTITLHQEGFNTIVFKATNGAGLETVKKEIVNIQIY